MFAHLLRALQVMKELSLKASAADMNTARAEVLRTSALLRKDWDDQADALREEMRWSRFNL
jgi:hypothetical protein